MKRVAGTVALQTVGYIIGGLQRVIVRDIRNRWVDGDYDVIFDGLWKDWYGDTVDRCRANRTALCGIKADGDAIILEVCTREERFC